VLMDLGASKFFLLRCDTQWNLIHVATISIASRFLARCVTALSFKKLYKSRYKSQNIKRGLMKHAG